MNIQHLISTMNRRDFAFVTEEMHCRRDCVVVNQNTEAREEWLEQDGLRLHALSTPERGLSRSRNMLLQHATGDVCIICDDDLDYPEGYTEIIEDAYRRHPKSDVIVFQYAVTTAPDRGHHPVRKLEGRIGWRQVSRVRSVEITIRPESIRKAGISFDHAFGLGATYQTGEENIFIADCLRAGLRVTYVPRIICVTPPTPAERTKFAEGLNEDYFHCKGACLSRIYGKGYPLFALGYRLAKRKTFPQAMPVKQIKTYMKEGKRAAETMKRGGAG